MNEKVDSTIARDDADAAKETLPAIAPARTEEAEQTLKQPALSRKKDNPTAEASIE